VCDRLSCAPAPPRLAPAPAFSYARLMPAIDVLAIGAHPDDAELGCGATLARLARAGRKTGILDLTRGELGSRGTPALREKEAAEAAAILGVSERRNAGLPDGG